jgi:hypothetical protein
MRKSCDFIASHVFGVASPAEADETGQRRTQRVNSRGTGTRVKKSVSPRWDFSELPYS